MIFEPLRTNRIGPLGLVGRNFCADMPHSRPTKIRAQHEKPEDRETVENEFGWFQGRVERDLHKVWFMNKVKQSPFLSLLFHFIKMYWAFLFVAYCFYSVKLINNIAGMVSKAYLEASRDALVTRVTFEKHWESSELALRKQIHSWAKKNSSVL